MKLIDYQNFTLVYCLRFETLNYDSFEDRIKEFNEEGIPIQMLLTGGIGLASEGGEFLELVKKIVFQKKEYNESVKMEMIKELGDVMWYLAQACNALNINITDVIHYNVEKLKKRYDIEVS